MKRYFAVVLCSFVLFGTSTLVAEEVASMTPLDK